MDPHITIIKVILYARTALLQSKGDMHVTPMYYIKCQEVT